MSPYAIRYGVLMRFDPLSCALMSWSSRHCSEGLAILLQGSFTIEGRWVMVERLPVRAVSVPVEALAGLSWSQPERIRTAVGPEEIRWPRGRTGRKIRKMSKRSVPRSKQFVVREFVSQAAGANISILTNSKTMAKLAQDLREAIYKPNYIGKSMCSILKAVQASLD